MANGKIGWKVLITGASVITTQSLLGTTINNLFPQLTGQALGFLSVGGVVTAAIGVWIGEMVVQRYVK